MKHPLKMIVLTTLIIPAVIIGILWECAYAGFLKGVDIVVKTVEDSSKDS
jgi:hypothetical protein